MAKEWFYLAPKEETVEKGGKGSGWFAPPKGTHKDEGKGARKQDSRFSGPEGGPRAYAATVHGQKLSTREFVRGVVAPALGKVLEAQRPYRRSQGAWRRLEKERDILADAKSYDYLQRPRYSRMETYAHAAKVAEKYLSVSDAKSVRRMK